MTSLTTLVVGYVGGVFLRSLFSQGWEMLTLFVVFASIFGAAWYFTLRKIYAVGAIFCIVFTLGVLRTSLAETPLPQSFLKDVGMRVQYEGKVVGDPDVRDSTARVELSITKEGAHTHMLAVVPRNTPVRVGDWVTVSGTLTLPEAFEDTSGRIFHYEHYLERSGVQFLLNFASLRVLNEAPWYNVPAQLVRIKHRFIEGIQVSLPEPYAALAGGMVIGGKSGLGEDLQQDFIRSGLIPIIVLSGYNVMIVAELIMALLGATPLSRRTGAIAGAASLLIFVGIAGGGATALRATLMALIALYARATGRTYIAGRALLLTVLVMLLWNPLYLVFDPGFSLSVAATAGLIWIAPLFERRMLITASPFWNTMIATTLAAQITVLPLLLYYTGNLSLVALPANLLVLPIVPLTMALTAFAGFFGVLFGASVLTTILSFPTYMATVYIVAVAEQSARMPFGAFVLPPFPFWLVCLMYAAIIYFASLQRFSAMSQFTFAKNAST